ncbi:MAG: suppressor of fused domain protein, partial [Acidothermales bacterium]|nr:suppressor of fused domain protein [Acidothermales bacterium]
MALFGKRRQAEADQADGTPRTLLDETSPYGSRRVLVATNGIETWAQLFDGSGQQVTALWLAAHRGPAPDVQLSVPPEATRSPNGRPQLSRVEAIWFEEGDGVALFDGDGMLAVLPGWAGPDTLPGYAREAVSPSPSAAPLQGAFEQFAPRAERARAYWDWRNRPTSWQEFQAELQHHVASRLGPPQGVWPLGNGMPPVVAERHGSGAEHIALTVGMSGQRMPTVEQHMDDPGPQSRIELAVAGLGGNNADLLLLNWLARYPWRATSWLGSRHFVRWPGDGFPVGAPFAGALLVDEPSLLAGPPAPDLSGYHVFGDAVRFLWLVPITEEEM